MLRLSVIMFLLCYFHTLELSLRKHNLSVTGVTLDIIVKDPEGRSTLGPPSAMGQNCKNCSHNMREKRFGLIVCCYVESIYYFNM